MAVSGFLQRRFCALIVRIGNGVVVVIVVTGISLIISVKIFLIVVCSLWTVVFHIQNFIVIVVGVAIIIVSSGKGSTRVRCNNAVGTDIKTIHRIDDPIFLFTSVGSAVTEDHFHLRTGATFCIDNLSNRCVGTGITGIGNSIGVVIGGAGITDRVMYR